MEIKSLKTIIGILPLLIFSLSLPLALSHSEGEIAETIARRDLVIDLGDGMMTDAQLTFPNVGEGPFPAVLLVQGSGPMDMDEYIPPPLTGTGIPARPFLQIAEYLSQRGFAVLRYNKRGVGLNGTLFNENVYLSMTFQDLLRDAEKVLGVLVEQSEVDLNDITVLGHSEGTIIAPRIAIENSKVKKIVLLGAAAHNLYNISYFQFVDRVVFYAKDVLDSSQDGLLSLQEVVERLEVELEYLSPLPANELIDNSTGEWRWHLGLDADEDSYLSIEEELKPLLLRQFEYFTTSHGMPLYRWTQSHFALDSNLAIIGNVSASILILQGEGDIQTPVEEAFLLEQRLTEIAHPDHTLITYLGLGHSFYPVDAWIQPLGPMQEYVLSDLAAWLRDAARKTSYFTAQINALVAELDHMTSELENATTKISELEGQFSNQLKRLDQNLDAANQKIGNLESQVTELQSELSLLQDNVAYMEKRNCGFQLALDLSRSLTYLTLGIAAIALAVALMAIHNH